MRGKAYGVFPGGTRARLIDSGTAGRSSINTLMLYDDLLCDDPLRDDPLRDDPLSRDLLAVFIRKIFDIDLLAPSAALRPQFWLFWLMVVWARGQIVGPPILNMSVRRALRMIG